MDASQALRECRNLTALVIGDVMIDAYLIGEVNRISPEAPVPVVDVKSRDRRLGGAANVAKNLLSMGAKVHLASVIGTDEAGDHLRHLLLQLQIGDSCIVDDPSRPTTIKTRVISNGQQLLRVDEETVASVHANVSAKMVNRCIELFDSTSIDVVIFEDYDKGVLTLEGIQNVVAAAQTRGIPVTVDPKFNQFHSYVGVDLFKPNLKELREGLNIPIGKEDDQAIASAIDQLTSQLRVQNVLVTLSERGVWLHSPIQGVSHKRIPAFQREINDVSGAGDTVIAVASLMLALHVPLEQLAAISNLAGGLVCEKVGVAPIDKEQLILEWDSNHRPVPSSTAP
jgi:rfaE bifunctional protein kinase chain/domain